MTPKNLQANRTQTLQLSIRHPHWCPGHRSSLLSRFLSQQVVYIHFDLIKGVDFSSDVKECEEHGCHYNGECTNYHGSVYASLGMTSSLIVHRNLVPTATTAAMKGLCQIALQSHNGRAGLSAGCPCGSYYCYCHRICAQTKQQQYTSTGRKIHAGPGAKRTNIELYEIAHAIHKRQPNVMFHRFMKILLFEHHKS